MDQGTITMCRKLQIKIQIVEFVIKVFSSVGVYVCWFKFCLRVLKRNQNDIEGEIN